MKEISLLADDTDVGHEGFLFELTHIGAGESNFPARDLVKAWDQVRHGSFTGTRGADEGGVLPRFETERDVDERRLLRIRVGEGHIVELDSAQCGPVDGARGGSIRYRRRQIEVFEDPREQRLRCLQVECDPHQSEERPHQSCLHGGERHDGAGGKRHLAEQKPGRHEVDDGRDYCEKDLHGGEEPLAAHLLLHLQHDLVVVFATVSRDLGGLLRETLGQQYARNGERLLRDRCHVTERFLCLRRDFGACFPHPPLGDDENRHQDDGDQRELPRQHEHRHERGRYRHSVTEHTRDGVREYARDSTHIVLQPGLDDSGLRAREEGEFHALQVAEESDAQGPHDLVADRRGQPGLPHAEPCTGDVDADHDRDQFSEDRQIRSAARRKQPLVECALREQRRQHGECSADHDKDDRDGQGSAVRCEKLCDALQ